MDPRHFDRLTQALFTTGSRRAALAALLAAAGTGLGGAGRPPAAAQTSCSLAVNGRRCRSGADCCSGWCKRKHNGKKVCKPANGQGNCTIEQDVCAGSGGGSCNGSAECSCSVTTSGQSFCGGDGTCAACTRDADCEGGMGPGPKCVQCPRCGGSNTACRLPCPTPG